MAPRDVRERFEPGADGSWQSVVGGAKGETAIEWRRSAQAQKAGAVIRQARFEFHLGMLVAIRASTDDKTVAERITTTPATVTARRPDAAGGTSIVVLARDCPTHKDEAEGLAARSSR